MVKKLAEKNALITGASRGLGKHIAATLADAGATVFINYANNKEAADEAVSEIKAEGGIAHAVKANVTDEENIEQMFNKIKEVTGSGVDILVNNATGPQPELSIEENTWDTYMDQLNFFVKAPLLLTKAALPHMKAVQAGRIINIGSEVAQLGNANFSNYVTAKSAMIGMTRSWASELGEHGITVNLVNPGFTPVERHEGTGQSTFDSYLEDVPIKRMGLPQDIAKAVEFLASEDSSFITGQSLSVNGGKTFGI